MKSKLFISRSLVAIICLLCVSCGGKSSTNEDEQTNKPLNITVVLDLSDRLTRDLTPPQFERDTAIVQYVIDQFISNTQHNGQLSKSNNCMRVMLYPEPSLTEIAKMASDLDVNLAKAQPADKKKLLLSMKSTFQADLDSIYHKCLLEKNWVGSDIWGFFSNKDVDKYCMMDGYRNIVILLTDGYLYHANNKIKQGENYSYILPNMLSQPNLGLIVQREGLQDLEVLVLEVNPYDPKTCQQLNSVLETWFEGMGVGKIEIANTAMPKNTELVIDKFFNR